MKWSVSNNITPYYEKFVYVNGTHKIDNIKGNTVTFGRG